MQDPKYPWNRTIQKLVTLYRFCSDYHSGQWSRGYRLLCRTHAALERRGVYSDPFALRYDRDLYRALEEKYAERA